MPRYELIEGSSKKFWEIAREGASFTTTYGRIGTEGQSSLKEYESEERAQREHDKLIAEKTKKGYVLVDGLAATAPTPPAKKAAEPADPQPRKQVFADEGDDEEDEEEGEEHEREEPKAKVTTKAGALKKPAAGEPRAEKSAAAPKAPPPPGASKSGEAGARYFEFVDGASSKFWEIKLEGAAFTTRYGKIGTDGQMSMKEYESSDRAQREHDKLIAEKTRKGYQEK